MVILSHITENIVDCYCDVGFKAWLRNVLA